jgi:uncharacterized membrane protein YcjF (UPF0283 family)
MIVNDKEFPVVVQAYQSSGNQELFVAEQVVNTQTEVDSFSSRYAGFVIKARVVNDTELQTDRRTVRERNQTRRRSGAAAWALILLVLVALVVVGWTTGWIQKTFNLNIDRIEVTNPS